MSLPNTQADSDKSDDETRIQEIEASPELALMSEIPGEGTTEPVPDPDGHTVLPAVPGQAVAEGASDTPYDDQTQVVQPPPGQYDATMVADPSNINSFHPSQMDFRQQSDSLAEQKRLQLDVGKTIKNKYFLESKLGEGGMGTVFKARNTLWAAHGDRNPYVAIKVLIPEYSDNKALVASLFSDFKRTRMLGSCPNIVNVQDFDEDGVHVFMALEYLVGKTLSDHIKQSPKPMDFAQAWPIMQGIGNALDFAHRHDIVHRDIKPDNIFITEDPKDTANATPISKDRIKVLDFGIASKINESEGDKTRFNGEDLGAFTPAYASPEMKENCDPDVRDDIYAFGCVIYEMLTGKQYFKQKKVMTEPVSKATLPELSTRQREGLKKSLASIRDQRVASISELMELMRPGVGISPKHIGFSVAAMLAMGLGLWWFVQHKEIKAPPENPAVANQPVENKPVVPPGLPATTIAKTDAPAVQPPAAAAAAPVSQPSYNNDSPDGLLHIETSKTEYKKGDAFQINYSLSKPMYLRILDRDAANAISRLFPNKLQDDKRMAADKTYTFPPAGKAKVNSPAGISTVTIVASEQPFPKNIELLAEDGSVSRQVQTGSYSWTQIRYDVQ